MLPLCAIFELKCTKMRPIFIFQIYTTSQKRATLSLSIIFA